MFRALLTGWPTDLIAENVATARISVPSAVASSAIVVQVCAVTSVPGRRPGTLRA